MDTHPPPTPPSGSAVISPSTSHQPDHSPPKSSSRKPKKTKPKSEPLPPVARTPPDATDNKANSPSSARPSNISLDQQQSHPAPSSRFTAHLQPYPGPGGPAYHVMNPSYPVNGSPYPSSPSPFHQPSGSGQPANGQPAHVGPGIPGHTPQYPYAVHAAPYHPGYLHYPSYPAPQPSMMYPQPSQGQSDPNSSSMAGGSSSVSSAPAPGKRKRKSTVDSVRGRTSDEEGADSGSDINRATTAAPQSAPAGMVVDTKKRTKTQRACDSCRSRKIRCDILPDSDPQICQHCKQYGFECTFFLPITETRFKKKKLEEEAAAAAAAAEKEKEKEAERSPSSPHTDHTKGDARVYGPTSATHLLHSQAMIPSRAYDVYDSKYHHSWDVSRDGEGIIRVHEPQPGELQLAMPKPVDLQIERDVVEKLVNAYFTEVAPILPVVTQAEFIASTRPPPILLYSMCLVAAASREVPQSVFDLIRYTVNGLIKTEDVLSTASLVNVQSLLILAMVADCHSQYVPNALSALWIRLGSAIRMAQDLGLHRAETVKENIELRRRLWGICVISDRWISLTYGHPYMIDVQDCDVRLPSSGDRNDLYMDELVRLSVILGRVLKAIYTPAGLTVTNDEALHALLADLESWRDNLPADLKFRGAATSRNAGMLFLLYASTNMIFWRVFMRISYSCPEHLKFSLTVEQWSALVTLTGEAIDWLDANEKLYDVWLLVAYCATSCALVQYHTWARRRDVDAQAKLRKLRDCVRRWEASLSPDHMSARRKTAEIISLLYEATQSPEVPVKAPPLNPTGGVKPRPPPPLGGLVFQKDPSRPGGGVFIAHGKAVEGVKNLPEGVVISRPDDDQGEMTAARRSSIGPTSHGRRRTFSLSRPSDTDVPWMSERGSYSADVQQAHRKDHRTSHQSAGQAQSPTGYGPLAGEHFPNMNPAMEDVTAGAPGQVQVMNVLDQASGTLEQMASVDIGFLEGIPGSMFDWGQWDNFFSRFPGTFGQQHQQHQHQHQQQQRAGPSNMPLSPHSQQSSHQYSYSAPPGPAL